MLSSMRSYRSSQTHAEQSHQDSQWPHLQTLVLCRNTRTLQAQRQPSAGKDTLDTSVWLQLDKTVSSLNIKVQWPITCSVITYLGQVHYTDMNSCIGQRCMERWWSVSYLLVCMQSPIWRISFRCFFDSGVISLADGRRWGFLVQSAFSFTIPGSNLEPQGSDDDILSEISPHFR